MKNQINLTVMLRLFTVLIASTLFSQCAEEEFNPRLTEKFSIASAANGATYKIQVALPVNFDASIPYKTIYVLDGEEDFGFVANNGQEIAARYSRNDVLVVGIGYGNDRSLDYTPTVTDEKTGGAPQFLEFLRDELIPEIEQRYGADSARNSRVILGHSYGGLFAAYAFAKDNELFGNYIVLSPSLWYDSEITMKMEKEHRASNASRSHLLFMGIGEMENSGRMQAPFEGFYQALTRNYPDLKIAKHREQDLGHVGSKHPNIIQGLEYYFEQQLH